MLISIIIILIILTEIIMLFSYCYYSVVMKNQ